MFFMSRYYFFRLIMIFGFLFIWFKINYIILNGAPNEQYLI